MADIEHTVFVIDALVWSQYKCHMIHTHRLVYVSSFVEYICEQKQLADHLQLLRF